VGDSSAISWCDATFNGWWGCEKVSPACAHCYAERDSNRYGQDGLWGKDHRIRLLSDDNWRKPLLWAARAREGKMPDGSENLDGHRPRVFTASMADVFEERLDLDPLRKRLFELIAATPELDWLVLTKRPPSLRDLVTSGDVYESIWDTEDHWSLRPNIWMGVSIENAAFTWRADALRAIPARVRFLSCEPLLGSLFPETQPLGRSAPAGETAVEAAPEGGTERRRRASLDLTGIDWVIVGGESGPRAKARPTHPAWVREIRDAVQLAPHRPALHFKQWGSWTPDEFGRDPNGVWVNPNGSVVTSFQADVYEDVLHEGAVRMRYAGPRPGDGGKFIDGTDHCEFPPSAAELVLA
jgi:protein gp37